MNTKGGKQLPLLKSSTTYALCTPIYSKNKLNSAIVVITAAATLFFF